MQNSDLHPEKHIPKNKKSNQINTDFSSYSLHCNSDSEFSQKPLVILQNWNDQLKKNKTKQKQHDLQHDPLFSIYL